jgi:hypothetical protein
MKNVVFWDVTTCGSCKNRHFGGTYRFHHLGDMNRRARNTVSSNKQPKHATHHTPHGVTSQKMVFLIGSVV